MKNLTDRVCAWLVSRDDNGYSTETVVITALLALAAVALGGAIRAAVNGWIEQIPAGG